MAYVKNLNMTSNAAKMFWHFNNQLECFT